MAGMRWMRTLLLVAVGAGVLLAIFLWPSEYAVRMGRKWKGKSLVGRGGSSKPKRVDPKGEAIAEGAGKVDLASWQTQEGNPFAEERVVTCGDAAADAAVEAVVDKLQMGLQGDYREGYRIDHHIGQDPILDTHLVELQKYKWCPTAALNAALLAFANERDAQELLEESLKGLDKVPEGMRNKLRAKATLFLGVLREFNGEDMHEVAKVFMAAIGMNADLSLEYFGMTARGLVVANNLPLRFHKHKVQVELKPDGDLLVQRTIRKLVLAREFLPKWGGYPVITPQAKERFQDDWFSFVPNLIPSYVVKVVQLYYRGLVETNQLSFDDTQAKRYYGFNEGVTRFLANPYRTFVSRMVSKPAKPTYTYFGGYVGAQNSDLAPHLDRFQCEYTMSVNVDLNPITSYCPLALGVKAQPGISRTKGWDPSANPVEKPEVANQRYVYPKPGDGLIFRGRYLVHWRDKLPPNTNCTNVFLHFVDADFDDADLN